MRLLPVVWIAGAALLCAQQQAQQLPNPVDTAIEQFQRAIQQNPNDVAARFNLGSALMAKWMVNSKAAENEELGERAAAEFRFVHQVQPTNKLALINLAALAHRMAANAGQPTAVPNSTRASKLEEAADWNQKILILDPNDTKALYSLGVIAWEQAYPQIMAARVRLGMQPQTPAPLTDANTRANLRNRVESTIQSGMNNLEKSIALDPNYSDAMAYLNLMYRLRADLRDAPADATADTARADDWVRKALAAKRAGAQRASNSLYSPAPPPPPPRPSVADGPGRIRVGSNVQAANRIDAVPPVYPPLAKQARVQGTVKFDVVIGKEGDVQNIQLMSGHPLLVTAAQQAVQQWRYRPTLLNGQPVEVITQIDVNFTLSE